MRPNLKCLVTERSGPVAADAQLDLEALRECLRTDEPETAAPLTPPPLEWGSASTAVAMQLHYQTNFTVKGLTGIAGYYGLRVQRARKDAIVAAIVKFESDSANIDLTLQRRRCWGALAMLGGDDFFRSAFLVDCRPRGTGPEQRVQLALGECAVV